MIQLAALSAMIMLAIPLVASPAYAVTGYTASGMANLRPGPNTKFIQLSQTYTGQPLDILCQTSGETVNGSAIWDYVAVNGMRAYLSDLFVNETPYAKFDPRLQECGYPVRTSGMAMSYNSAVGGQCTWGAKEKFREYTGVYPDIHGSAKDWDTSAKDAGWTVVPNAQARSILVFEPNVLGADATYGHVAWVDAVRYGADGEVVSLDITEMNAGGQSWVWHKRTIPDLPGMSYILAPAP